MQNTTAQRGRRTQNEAVSYSRLSQKYQFLIVILSLLAGLFFYVYMQRQQTYSATAVISYTNDGAEDGLAPDGSQIDVSEIYSSQVMSRVFERMGLNYDDHNLDELRSRVSINEIVSEEDKAVAEAKNEAGETVESKPTKYYVTFTAKRNDSDQPEKFARQVLDNMLDVYIQTYGENHINTSLAAMIFPISTQEIMIIWKWQSFWKTPLTMHWRAWRTDTMKTIISEARKMAIPFLICIRNSPF